MNANSLTARLGIHIEAKIRELVSRGHVREVSNLTKCAVNKCEGGTTTTVGFENAGKQYAIDIYEVD